MVFPSYEFAFFFPVVLSVSWALMSRPRLWKPFVLAASYIFYAAASAGYALLLAAVTLAKPARGGAGLPCHLGERPPADHGRHGRGGPECARAVQVLRVLRWRGRAVPRLPRAGLCRYPLLSLALPIGLSFITFQAISYVVDVKRGHLQPASTLDFALYLSFFPHVVAGPNCAGA